VTTVICMLAGGAGGGISQPAIWQEWQQDAGEEIGFCLYSPTHGVGGLACEQAPIHGVAEIGWGQYGLVELEARLLAHAYERFPNATWFFVRNHIKQRVPKARTERAQGPEVLYQEGIEHDENASAAGPPARGCLLRKSF
jgi:hypothetical protein